MPRRLPVELVGIPFLPQITPRHSQEQLLERCATNFWHVEEQEFVFLQNDGCPRTSSFHNAVILQQFWRRTFRVRYSTRLHCVCTCVTARGILMPPLCIPSLCAVTMIQTGCMNCWWRWRMRHQIEGKIWRPVPLGDQDMIDRQNDESYDKVTNLRSASFSSRRDLPARRGGCTSWRWRHRRGDVAKLCCSWRWLLAPSSPRARHGNVEWKDKCGV